MGVFALGVFMKEAALHFLVNGFWGTFAYILRLKELLGIGTYVSQHNGK
jgi:hypothetical protein